LSPEFQAVDAMTRDEAIHFRRTLPLARINMTSFTELDESELTNGVLIASVYERRDEMRRILPFIYWARANGWPVWVRPHPREDKSFWIQEVDSNLVRIEDGDASFFDALSRLRPRIVASWYSTALADALNKGIVPVTINDETTPAVADMVYPLLERALQWPRDEEQLVRLMGDGETYRAFVSSLRGDMSAAGV
jgi:hypothetical protein